MTYTFGTKLGGKVPGMSSAIAKTKKSAQHSSQSQGRILVADDDPLAIKSIERQLGEANFDVVVAQDGEQAISAMDDEIAVALLDLHMPNVSGFECLAHCRRHHPDMHVIVVTASDDVADAVEAMKLGAHEYITKPCYPEELLIQVQQAVNASQQSRAHRGLQAIVGQSLPAAEFSTKSPAMKRLAKMIQRVAKLDSTVLITGESGTGKSTIARMIHQTGMRPSAPFVAVNCASLPRDLIEAELFGHAKGAFTGAVGDRPGRIEVANGGTLFLDEIGDLPLELQPKLLTFLQDRTIQRIGSNQVVPVDVRLIAATHQDLSSMCANKQFRQDLFYRINVLALEVPPVRERAQDIPDLVHCILSRISERRESHPRRLSEIAMQKLVNYSWPGNIREMENVLESATAFCEGELISDSELALHDEQGSQASNGFIRETSLAGMTLADVEKLAVKATLLACGGNKAKTARMLGISEKSIYNKLKRHGIQL